MKRTIKILGASLLIFAMMATMLTGCGDKSANGDVQTITIWTTASSSKAVYDKLIEEYNNGQGKKDGIFIDYSVKAGDSLKTSLELALQTGDAPDMFEGGSIKKMIEKGQVSPINDLPGGEEFLKYYRDNDMLANESTDFDGKTYVVPRGSTVRGLIYNKDMFRAAGIVDENGEPTPPKTYAEMIEYAKKLTDPSKNQYGYIMPLKWTGWFGSDVRNVAQASVGHIGYDMVNDKFDYKSMAPILETYITMFKNGSCMPGPESIDNDQARAYFAAGNIGMKMAFSFDVGVLNDQFPAECDWGVAPVPVLDVNDRYYQPLQYSYSYNINSEAAEKYGDKVMKVLEFFCSVEFMRECYKLGVSTPVKPEAIEGVEFGDDVKTGWVEFAELVKESRYSGLSPSLDSSNLKDLHTRFVEEVFNGKKSALQMLTEYDNDVTKATDAYYKAHPDEDRNIFVYKDRDIKKK